MLRRIRVVLLIAMVVALTLVSVQPTAAVTVDETDFTRGILAGSGITFSAPTALTVGPDGRLYVAEMEGRIRALTLDPATKAVTAVEEITTSAGLQEVFGIAFDPTDASSPAPIYVSNSLSGLGTAGPAPPGSFPGKITKIDGAGYANKADIITGLPSSSFTHQTNGLVFAGDGTLYIAQGSTTNAGLPGGPFALPEVPLSAAVLVASPSAEGFDGAITYDPPGIYSSTVDQVSGDVSVFASGLRNPYDLIIHSNGRIYLTDNGPDVNFGGGPASTGCASEGTNPQEPDELNIIEEGKYYGHPNRNRGRFDPPQCIYHSGPEGSGPDWTGPIALLPTSSNGIVEYTPGTFGGGIQGDLFYVSFNDGTLGHVVLSPDGLSVVSNTTFASGFNTPLDIAVGSDGTIYIAEWGGGRITFLQPNPPPVGGVSLSGGLGEMDGLRALAGESGGSFWLSGWLLAAAVAIFTATLGAAALRWKGAAWRARREER